MRENQAVGTLMQLEGQKGRKEKGTEIILENIILKNFPKFMTIKLTNPRSLSNFKLRKYKENQTQAHQIQISENL